MDPKKLLLDAIDRFSQVSYDVDKIINLTFYEIQNPNIIVINYDSNEDIFIICCENEKCSIPAQQFSDFFQKDNLQPQSKNDRKNDIFFCSKESYDKFN